MFEFFGWVLVVGLIFAVANFLAESFIRAREGEEAVKKGREEMWELLTSKVFLIPTVLLSLAVFLAVYLLQGH